MFRVSTIAALLIAGGLRADPPETKRAAKPLLRDYLPTLLLKTQLETTRDYTASLESLFKLAETLNDAGFISAAQSRQVEREMLQSRIEASKLEREHLDALDQFQARFDVKPDRIRELEDSAITPVLQQVRKFEEVCRDLDSLGKEISKFDDPANVQKLRGALGRIISTSPGLRDSHFRTDFALHFAHWHKQTDRELVQLMREKSEQRRKLFADKLTVEDKGQRLSPEGQRLLAESEFEIALGRLEMALRRYESEPWKDRDDAAQRQAEMFRTVANAFAAVMLHGYAERFDELRAGWPPVAPLMLGKVDLLASDREQAERAVADAVKNPEALASAKAKLRNLRSLADTYRIGARLVEMAMLQRQSDLDALRSPPVPADNTANSDTNGPVAQLLSSEKDLNREKARLYRTWIEMQITRLDLEGDLGLGGR